jgi:hypothetical protein
MKLNKTGKELKELKIPASDKPAREPAIPPTYGILFIDCRNLKYFDLGTRKTHELAETETGIEAALAKGEDVYYSWVKHDLSLFYRSSSEKRKKESLTAALFGSFKSEKRNGEVETLQGYKDAILDAGSYGLVDTLKNRVLISEEEMKKKGIYRIDSLQVGNEGNLFGLVWNHNITHGLIEILENSGKYFFGKELLNYGLKHDHGCQFIIVPQGRLQGTNKEYDSSVVSCVNLHYLDLNGEPIKGTEVEQTQYIHVLEPLISDGRSLEVIYSGYNIKQVIKAKIDLENKKLAKKEVLMDSFPGWADYFKPIQTKSLHEKLISASKKIEPRVF